MTLNDVDGSILGLLVDWLYMQKLQSKYPSGEDVSTCDHIKLWMLGDRCLMPRLQNEVMMTLEANWENFTKLTVDYGKYKWTEAQKSRVAHDFHEILNCVGGNVPKGSLLRGYILKLLIDYHQTLKAISDINLTMPESEEWNKDVENWLDEVIPVGMLAEILKITFSPQSLRELSRPRNWLVPTGGDGDED